MSIIEFRLHRDPFANALGDCVRRRREKLGMTVRQAAERAGLKPFHWMQLELGAWVPDDNDPDQQVIADALDVNPVIISFYALVSRQHQNA
jgi:transcriptional regulator with XRE-family HTH domain